jgi:hypothetical protein
MLVEDMAKNKCLSSGSSIRRFTFYIHLWSIYWLSLVNTIYRPHILLTGPVSLTFRIHFRITMQALSLGLIREIWIHYFECYPFKSNLLHAPYSPHLIIYLQILSQNNECMRGEVMKHTPRHAAFCTYKLKTVSQAFSSNCECKYCQALVTRFGLIMRFI